MQRLQQQQAQQQMLQKQLLAQLSPQQLAHLQGMPVVCASQETPRPFALYVLHVPWLVPLCMSMRELPLCLPEPVLLDF